jgi:hypothetical protein
MIASFSLASAGKPMAPAAARVETPASPAQIKTRLSIIFSPALLALTIQEQAKMEVTGSAKHHISEEA